jgi:fucose permease
VLKQVLIQVLELIAGIVVRVAGVVLAESVAGIVLVESLVRVALLVLTFEAALLMLALAAVLAVLVVAVALEVLAAVGVAALATVAVAAGGMWSVMLVVAVAVLHDTTRTTAAFVIVGCRVTAEDL